MFEQAGEFDVPGLLAYYEQDLKNCLYSYIDLKKYGIKNPHLHIYYLKKDGKITATATEYYKGLQLYSCENVLPAAEVFELVKKLDAPMINARKELIDQLHAYLEKSGGKIGFDSQAWDSEFGYVAWMQNLNEGADLRGTEKAGEDDCLSIAELICSDEGLGGHYVPEEFAQELIDRQRDYFGRNYVIRRDGRIVCHAATYAEIDNLAIVSGVICDEAYRGQGLGYRTVSALCHDLLSEGKKPCIFFFKKEAAGLYKKVGFEEPTGWGKLYKKI